MIILGIDPGYERCGFAVLEKQNRTLILHTFGVIKTQATKNFPLRLQEIGEDFQSLLDKYKPQVMSIEDLFFVQNITTGIKVAQVRGTLMYLAHKSGCQIVEPKPMEAKQAFTGNGHATKLEMQKMAQILFGMESIPTQDDAVDAIAAGFYATTI